VVGASRCIIGKSKTITAGRTTRTDLPPGNGVLLGSKFEDFDAADSESEGAWSVSVYATRNPPDGDGGSNPGEDRLRRSDGYKVFGRPDAPPTAIGGIN